MAEHIDPRNDIDEIAEPETPAELLRKARDLGAVAWVEAWPELSDIGATFDDYDDCFAAWKGAGAHA